MEFVPQLPAKYPPNCDSNGVPANIEMTSSMSWHPHNRPWLKVKISILEEITASFNPKNDPLKPIVQAPPYMAML
jgi:hypothetical protein